MSEEQPKKESIPDAKTRTPPDEARLLLYERLFLAAHQWSSPELEESMRRAKQESKALSKLPENLSRNAASYGFTVHGMPKDGNCFYHAVSHQLENQLGLKISHKKLRALTTQHILDNIDLYKKHEVDMEAFILQISTPGKWADELHLVALSRALNITLVIVRSDTAPPVFYTRPSSNTTVYLGYEVGLHYQSLVLSTPSRNLALQQRMLTAPLDPLYSDCLTFEALQRCATTELERGFLSIEAGKQKPAKVVDDLAPYTPKQQEYFNRLRQAIDKDETKTALALIKNSKNNGVNVNTLFEDDNADDPFNLLSLAACRFNFNLVQALLEAKADPNLNKNPEHSVVELMMSTAITLEISEGMKREEKLFGSFFNKSNPILRKKRGDALQNIIHILLCFGFNPIKFSEKYNAGITEIRQAMSHEKSSRIKITTLVNTLSIMPTALTKGRFAKLLLSGITTIPIAMANRRFKNNSHYSQEMNLYSFLSSTHQLPQHMSKTSSEIDATKKEIITQYTKELLIISELARIPEEVLEIIAQYTQDLPGPEIFAKHRQTHKPTFWQELEYPKQLDQTDRAKVDKEVEHTITSNLLSRHVNPRAAEIILGYLDDQGVDDEALETPQPK